MHQNLEPDKCEGWEWWTVEQLRQKYESQPKQLFLPMQNVFEQRPELMKALESGELP